MRKVIVSRSVWDKIAELRIYLSIELRLSEEAAMRRTDRIALFLNSLATPVNYELCRFRRWRDMGYRCATFEGWVFAYEILNEGIVIQDMSHGKLLADVVD
jgi:hypothetical protein